MAEFGIGSHIIGHGHPPRVIAEIGANHDGKPEKAARMLEGIATAGVTFVKFQLYSAEELVSDAERIVEWGPPGRRHREPIGEMFTRLSLSPGEMAELFAHARSLGLEPFATPFSQKGVDALVEMGVGCLKIASSDVTHIPLLTCAAKTGLPVILSLGKSTLAEADEAVRCLIGNGCTRLGILHCVATYPAPIREMNLRVIETLMHLYPDCVIGISDHSEGTTAAVAAVALGAQVVEKHVTLSRDSAGPDHWFSMEIAEIAGLVSAVEDTWHALGDGQKRVLPAEEEGRRLATRSLVATRDMAAGHVVSEADIKVVRPGTGIRPAHKPDVLGMRLERAVPTNTPLQWEDFHARDSSFE